MGKKDQKRKTWNVILFSGPRSSLNKFRVTRLFLILSFVFATAFMIAIAGYIYYLFYEKNLEQEVLYKEIDIREMMVAQVESEMEAVKRDYESLQLEALAVKRSIEEFKEYERRLSEVELEIPGESGDGSGGSEIYIEGIETTGSVSERMVELRNELPEIIKEFEDTVERILAYERELKTIPTIMPTETGRITSRFGYRRDPFTWNTSFHSGIDIAAPMNTPIYATAEGIVIHAGWEGSYGRKIIIEHNDIYTTSYSHLNRIDVQVGDVVEKGQKIGGMGTTGRSTGVHLHYEILRNDQHIDPYLYMTFHEKQD